MNTNTNTNTNTNEKEETVVCQFCGQVVKKSEYTSHILRKHPYEQ